MKFIFKYKLLLLLLLFISACKTESKKTVAISKEIAANSQIEVVQQQKDTVKVKSAIGKSYNKYLNEIDAFKGYESNGGHTIVDFLNEDESNGIYSDYGLETLSSYKKNKEDDSNSYEKMKYVIMTNGGEIIDYINIDNFKIDKKYLLHDEVWLNDKRDWELFAYAEQNDKGEQFITDIYKVFRADKETGKIFEVPTAGVKVQNLDYGF